MQCRLGAFAAATTIGTTTHSGVIEMMIMMEMCWFAWTGQVVVTCIAHHWGSVVEGGKF